MFKASNMIEVGGLAATAINIIQSQSLHEHETSHAKKRHEESMALAQMQHEKDLKIAKQTYLMAAFTSLEQHFQQLNADLISSSKESESDMFDQRNQSFQTVILSASVMFSSLSTVIIQGFLPSNADEFLFVSYALTSALSFAFLFLSIVLCIEVILRASSFMYNRARKHTTQLREAIQKTKLMMKRIRGGQFPDEEGLNDSPDSRESDSEMSDEEENDAEDYESNEIDGSNTLYHHNDDNIHNNDHNDENDNQLHNGYFSNGNHDDDITLNQNGNNNKHLNDKSKRKIQLLPKRKSKQNRRQIAEMKEEDLQIEWERHEAEVHKYLEEREKINDQTSVLVSADANSSRMSFEQFWRESCKFWADMAILFFYAGTANLLLAIMIYMWAEFFITYESPVGAVIAVVLIGVSLVSGILLAIYLRQNDTYGKGIRVQTRRQRATSIDMRENEREEDTKRKNEMHKRHAALPTNTNTNKNNTNNSNNTNNAAPNDQTLDRNILPNKLPFRKQQQTYKEAEGVVGDDNLVGLELKIDEDSPIDRNSPKRKENEDTEMNGEMSEEVKERVHLFNIYSHQDLNSRLNIHSRNVESKDESENYNSNMLNKNLDGAFLYEVENENEETNLINLNDRSNEKNGNYTNSNIENINLNANMHNNENEDQNQNNEAFFNTSNITSLNKNYRKMDTNNSPMHTSNK